MVFLRSAVTFEDYSALVTVVLRVLKTKINPRDIDIRALMTELI